MSYQMDDVRKKAIEAVLRVAPMRSDQDKIVDAVLAVPEIDGALADARMREAERDQHANDG